MNEVQLMGQQQHPAVLPLYAAFLVDDQLWMVLPYVAGGSAEDVLKRQGTPVREQDGRRTVTQRESCFCALQSQT